MPPLLKNRWEKFCVAYFYGKSGTGAAVEAGYTPTAARQAAWCLLKKGQIRARIKELQESLANAKIMSVQERIERLSEIARERLASDQIKMSDQLKAIDVLNKMEGQYRAAKVEANSEEELVTRTVFIMPDGSRKTPLELADDRNIEGSRSPPRTG